MNEDVQLIYNTTEESMQEAIDHLEKELANIRAGKATPAMLDSVKLDYYGALTPLSQVANVNSLDGRTLSVQPWEKDKLEDIERAIMNANLGLNPQNNGELIIINIPTLTEERRKELVKRAKADGEQAKVSIRNARKDANDEIKKLGTDGLSEDMCKDAEGKIQELTDRFVKKVDQFVDAKENDIMTV